MTHSSKRNKNRRPGRGAVLLIAALFLGSVAIRLIDGTGAAVAREIEELTDTRPSFVVSESECTDPDHIRDLLADLQAREERVKDEETAVAERQRALEVAEKVVNDQIAQLVSAEAELAATMSLAKNAAENDIARLTTVYESMKPKEAIQLFEAMDPEFSAGFLARMRPDAAAPILSGLQPQTAYSISVILAGRNADVPTE